MLLVQNASKFLPDGSPLFEGVTFNVAGGEAIAIVGRSGCGKSTLLSILGHLDRFDGGDYQLHGKQVASLSSRELDRSRAEEIGFIFQRFALIPHLSLLENVIVTLRHSGKCSEREMKRMGLAALESVGMETMWRRMPRRLSGGEQQRVAIARALIHSPQLILADEPTGSLDQATGAHVIDILRARVREQGASLVVVTHDLDIAGKMDRTMRMSNGTLQSLHTQVQE